MFTALIPVFKGQSEAIAAELKKDTTFHLRNHEFSVNIGYGTYLMKSLKMVMDMEMENNIFPLTKTHSFPPNYNFSARYGFGNKSSENLRRFSGITTGFQSSGSRLSHEDRTGYYNFSMYCKAISMGFYKTKSITEFDFLNKKVNVGFYWDLSLVYTIFDVNTQFEIYNTPQIVGLIEKSSEKYKALGPSFQPLGYLKLNILDNLSLELAAGLSLGFSSNIYAKNIIQQVDFFDKQVNIDWSGLRIKAGLVYLL